MIQAPRSKPLLWGVCLVALSLALAPSTASAGVPFQVLETTTSARPLTAKVEVAQSPEELLAIWREFGREDQPPSVDFRRHSVIANFSGFRLVGGYCDAIEKVEIRGGEMILSIVESTPSSNGGGQAGISPGVAIITILWKRPVVPVVRLLVQSCY